MDLPKVFISSTIYDMKDLRSALKFWLNEQGFIVQMSDQSDFRKNSSENSYQACLDTISNCDYFILIIGSRVGGLYSTNPKLSITHKEYKYAYNLAKQGKIKKIIIFIRQSIWDIKDDRKSLQKFLNEEYFYDKEIIATKKEKPISQKDIVNHNSNFVNDAEYIFSFIDDVRKSEEMKKAVTGEMEYPSHNWINTFSNFNEIVDVLINELNVHHNISIKIWMENIMRELSSNLSHFIFIYKYGEISFSYKPIKKILDNIDLLNEEITLSGQEMAHLITFVTLGASRIHYLSTVILEGAILSGLFLKYDSYMERYTYSDIQNALIETLECINRIKAMKDSINTEYLIKLNRQFANFTSSPDFDYECEYKINNCRLNPLKFLNDDICRIDNLAKYIFMFFKNPELNCEYPSILIPDEWVIRKATTDEVYKIFDGYKK